jgi:N-acetylglucosamine-6-phosphate deacetylase
MSQFLVETVGPQGFGTYAFDRETKALSTAGGSPDHVLTPGFVDMHIHGAFGADFLTSTPAELKVMGDRLWEAGYDAILATTVTAPASTILSALEKLDSHPIIAGFHLEGPFLSDRFPGAQPPEAIIPIPTGASEWDAVFDHPQLRQITLAPEIPNALALTGRLASRGVVVSMGHTNATTAEVAAAMAEGASQATHTYNAMRPLHHREAGTVGAVLLFDDLFAELIYDRIHVGRDAAGVLIKCKPMDRLIAISDGTMASGLPAGLDLEMWGLKVRTGFGEVRLLDGTLAGSGITLKDAFLNLWSDFGLELAIRACSINPRERLGLPVRRWNLFSRTGELIDRFVV